MRTPWKAANEAPFEGVVDISGGEEESRSGLIESRESIVKTKKSCE